MTILVLLFLIPLVLNQPHLVSLLLLHLILDLLLLIDLPIITCAPVHFSHAGGSAGSVPKSPFVTTVWPGAVLCSQCEQ